MKYKIKFMNMMLTKKLLAVYIAAVMIPTFLLFGVFYRSNLRGLERTYYENQRNALLTAKENLTISLEQIAAARNYYQNSDTLLMLLSGAYKDVSSTLFYYIRDVRPLIKATRVNPHIQDVYIYGYEQYAVDMEKGLASISRLEKDEEFIKKVQSVDELWEFTMEGEKPELCYYRNIYVNAYPYNWGILKFSINLEKLLKSFSKQAGRPLFFQFSDNRIISYENGKFVSYEGIPPALNHRKNQIYTLTFGDGFPDILVAVLPMERVGQQRILLILIFLFLFIVFTIFYFLLNASITRRLRAFAAHLNESDSEELKPFEEGGGYQDEVGVAITSYNGLVKRTNHLIHENLEVQLRQKKSEYYALQAQIQPHFLYNVLENIRMNAEAHQDFMTADMLLALGKHMRYTLNRKLSPIPLEEELSFAKNYLQVYQIRLKEKLQYEVLCSTEIDEVYCPKFLLQPLLENALHHAFQMERQLLIQVLVSDGKESGREGSVRVDILDDGNGIPEEQLKQMQEKLQKKQVEESSHVGLLNVNSRLSSFQKDAEGIFLKSKEGEGTHLHFYLSRDNNRNENSTDRSGL